MAEGISKIMSVNCSRGGGGDEATTALIDVVNAEKPDFIVAIESDKDQKKGFEHKDGRAVFHALVSQPMWGFDFDPREVENPDVTVGTNQIYNSAKWEYIENSSSWTVTNAKAMGITESARFLQYSHRALYRSVDNPNILTEIEGSHGPAFWVMKARAEELEKLFQDLDTKAKQVKEETNNREVTLRYKVTDNNMFLKPEAMTEAYQRWKHNIVDLSGGFGIKYMPMRLDYDTGGANLVWGKILRSAAGKLIPLAMNLHIDAIYMHRNQVNQYVRHYHSVGFPIPNLDHPAVVTTVMLQNLPE